MTYNYNFVVQTLASESIKINKQKKKFIKENSQQIFIVSKRE